MYILSVFIVCGLGWMVLRTWILCLFFLFMTVISVWSEYINKSFWILKFIVTIGLFVSFWWLDNGMFDIWAEVTRYVSFLWLLAQGLLLLDFAHDCHG